MRVVGELPPETEITIQLYRPHRFGGGERGELLTVRSKLGKWPVKDVDGIIVSRPKYPAWRGMRVDYSSAREKIVRYEAFLPGVMVVDVAPESRAAQAQLQFGDIITEVQGNPVQTPAEFHKATEKLRGDVQLRLYVDRTGGRATATIAE
jgi:serine protease Do